MSDFTDNLVAQAMHEYEKFENGKGRETDDPFCQYVGNYWSVGLKNSHIDGRTTYQDSKGKSYRPAWSSAFISYVVRCAGATESQFLFSEGHIHYVVDAIRDAAAHNTTVAYLGRDPRVYVPKVGDLINAGRGSAADVTYATVLQAYGPEAAPKGNFMPSHSDIVVEVDPQKGKLVTIGGNVAVDTVGRKVWQLDQAGRLAKGATLISVLECML
ncbi:DUF2272 domain-containing protein [Rhizobium sp. C1]|uniref:DUF2272 domain-containing protein n=1 Tax=Rhizobium sp. C1 TaxID=1349799 RepID=UPI001E45F6D7|nr:DUF2272 domain-containing protein [Rhizobium sp. C1]MCD2180215.1 DUF2272 domain-containing protein [Rhizobium sp. C1]